MPVFVSPSGNSVVRGCHMRVLYMIYTPVAMILVFTICRIGEYLSYYAGHLNLIALFSFEHHPLYDYGVCESPRRPAASIA
jgi:hypothetical protein